MSNWVISIIFGVGMGLFTAAATYFTWELIKQGKQRAEIQARIEKLHKACTS